MTIMTTSRCYWVDWICLFDKQPTPKDIQQKYSRMKEYIEGYLKNLSQKQAKGPVGTSSSPGQTWEEWDRKKLKWCPIPPPAATKGMQNLPKTGKDWIALLHMEWDQMNDAPRVYNFKAYFEAHKSKKRYTGDTKGSMTPPAPPTPPGQL
ncbi:MAG TPA: hypothetical protein VFV68_15900 [Agriterribacter sp.]|nr:hypothetical protein [Agriterribacter sp.]